MDREDAVAEIADAAKRTRTRAPRWLWILAAVVGVGFTTLFAIAMVSSGDATSTTPPPPPLRETGGHGFGAGVVVGLVAGIAIGFAIARQVAAHSSRKRP